MLVVRQGHAEAVVAAAPEPDAAPTNDRERWAMDILAGLGNDRPTAATIAFIVEWTLAEDGGDGAMSRNNPLNTTQSGYNETATINGDGVKGYESRQDGLDATIRTLSYGYYVDIVAALQNNDPAAAKTALIASPWASSHYNGGAGWPVYSVQTPPPAPRCPVDPCYQSGGGYSADHPGVDLGATLGQPVYATISGVAHTSQTWPCGNGVSVTSGATMILMCHLSGFAVDDGAAVSAGDQVGAAGSSGQSTGPHVHFERRESGSNVDPLE
jgi:murein DD-endopeptidase MepM/ murein hydrolase activator NlpD